MIEHALTPIADDVNSLGLPWAVVGGLALCARATPRATADVDIALAVPSDAVAGSVVERMTDAGYVVNESIIHDETKRLATVRLTTPAHLGALPLDLFFASSGVETEVASAATPAEPIAGLALPVATLSHLIAVKFLWRANEKRDRDLRNLLSCATETDITDARYLLQTITERGYNRGRDLTQGLSDWLSASSVPAVRDGQV
ncbi:hypothetical protein [Aestuariimicrobium sp. T2.26MG-19.2B]|uniref:hypothetical protein n=1 Tax=Aestuariimicrobium sp. T2.26MG-19.2B TaxID=3040679 RepID=UPI0024773F32|nr:hypothetical protein [Aestuariimicrobium sp. T2.26MG-19.2B]CAI9407864.1 hypothetical protein AESSP_01911 [Aestuariimicrobium sp. T2.26MG-19.2B]